MKRIILCADDYGQNAAISQAIINLIDHDRISATSCLATSSLWLAHAKWLLPYQDKIDIGVHFNLTEGQPLSNHPGLEFLTLPSLIVKASLRRLDQEAIEKECHAQIDQFVAGMGRLPDFIDGHQHVHQFPIIRDAILNVYEKRLRAHNAYIRCVYDNFASSHGAYLKRFVIQLSGAAFKEKLLLQQVPHNKSFSGIYSFAASSQYAQFFPMFLHKVRDGGLIMCHPGQPDSEDKEDSIAASRANEYHYLMSEAFIQNCFAERVTLKKKTTSFALL